MSVLARPYTLRRGGAVPNRIVKSAMAEGLGDRSNHATAEHARLYARWAQGGAGLIITGNVMVSKSALAEPGNVVFDGSHPMAPLVAWAASATSAGGHAWVQINHPGRQVPRTMGVETVAPSAVPLEFGSAFRTPRALSDAEIQTIIGQFANAAGIAQDAGFTGVQIHAAHGYLVSQFLSPHTNRRTDAWGGDAARRRLFLLEIVRAIRARVGDSFPIGVKLNSADFQRGGFTEAESMQVVKALEEEGIDLLEISGGTYERPVMFSASSDRTSSREAFFLDYAEKVRKRTSLPILVTGGFRSGAAMTAAVRSGAIDFAGMARPLAVEPDLPGRLVLDPMTKAKTIRVRTGIAALDGMLVGIWYGEQLRRMGRGMKPNPRMSRLVPLWRYITGHWRNRPVKRGIQKLQSAS